MDRTTRREYSKMIRLLLGIFKCLSFMKTWLSTRQRRKFYFGAVFVSGFLFTLYATRAGDLIWKEDRDPVFERVVDPTAVIKPVSKRQLEIAMEVEAYMVKRRAQVNAVCAAHPELRDQFSNNSIIAKDYKLFYCPVPKVASTFWSRMFHQLLYTYPARSPFDVRVVDVLPSYFYKYKLHTKSISEAKRTISDHIKLIYVRDPFSRLFSAYVDKVLAPNPFFWKSWGADAIKKFRPESQNRSIQNLKPHCYHDATFGEVVLYATLTKGKDDVHFETVSQRCSPCLFNFTVIGKMETFYTDAVHLLTLLGINEEQVEFHKMNKDAMADAIDDSVKDSLSKKWLDLSLQCVSKESVLRRILRKLQIRGIISWRFNYRLSPVHAESMSYEKYTQILYRAADSYNNKTELKLQKKQAFLEAYSSLTPQQYKSIWNMYAFDIAMFDGSPLLKPDTYLPNLVSVNTHALDWTRDWDISPIL